MLTLSYLSKETPATPVSKLVSSQNRQGLEFPYYFALELEPNPADYVLHERAVSNPSLLASLNWPNGQAGRIKYCHTRGRRKTNSGL